MTVMRVMTRALSTCCFAQSDPSQTHQERSKTHGIDRLSLCIQTAIEQIQTRAAVPTKEAPGHVGSKLARLGMADCIRLLCPARIGMELHILVLE